MELIATLHVYSGRPNPVRLLSAEEIREFLRILRTLEVRTRLKASDIPSTLGYRGLTVTAIYGSSEITIRDGIVDLGSGQPSFLDRHRDLEKWLFENLFMDLVEPAVREEVSEYLSIQEEPDAFFKRLLRTLEFRPSAAVCVQMAEDAPVYAESEWNFSPVIKENTCYNYANNRKLRHEAEPGIASGLTVPYTAQGLVQGATADGLRFFGVVGTNLTPLGPGQGWYIAVATSNKKTDFHFLRQDACGCWSHKTGKHAASNLDDDHQRIVDPASAKLAGYSVFAYMVTTCRVNID